MGRYLTSFQSFSRQLNTFSQPFFHASDLRGKWKQWWIHLGMKVGWLERESRKDGKKPRSYRYRKKTWPQKVPSWLEKTPRLTALNLVFLSSRIREAFKNVMNDSQSDMKTVPAFMRALQLTPLNRTMGFLKEIGLIISDSSKNKRRGKTFYWEPTLARRLMKVIEGLKTKPEALSREMRWWFPLVTGNGAASLTDVQALYVFLVEQWLSSPEKHHTLTVDERGIFHVPRMELVTMLQTRGHRVLGSNLAMKLTQKVEEGTLKGLQYESSRRERDQRYFCILLPP